MFAVVARVPLCFLQPLTLITKVLDQSGKLGTNGQSEFHHDHKRNGELLDMFSGRRGADKAMPMSQSSAQAVSCIMAAVLCRHTVRRGGGFQALAALLCEQCSSCSRQWEYI